MQIDAQNLNFREELHTKAEQNLSACYQYKKCSAGCPVAYAMDYTPTQIIHLIGLGQKDLVLNSKTPWLCASCQTCTTRCPNEIDIAKVMDAIRSIALRSKVKIPLPDVAAFYQAALANIFLFGRLYELGLIGMLKFATRQFTKDLLLGFKMFSKGKLRIFPTFSRSFLVKRIFFRTKLSERKR